MTWKVEYIKIGPRRPIWNSIPIFFSVFGMALLFCVLLRIPIWNVVPVPAKTFSIFFCDKMETIFWLATKCVTSFLLEFYSALRNSIPYLPRK